MKIKPRTSLPAKQFEFFDKTRLGLSPRLRRRRDARIKRDLAATARRLHRDRFGKPERAHERRACEAGGTFYRTTSFNGDAL